MTLRQDIQAGKPLMGAFVGIPSPTSTEVICAAGPDFVCFDGEHAPLRGPVLENMLRASALHGVPALVRTPVAFEELLPTALDSGAAGVLVPHCSTPERAEAVVRAARYAPEGQRGAGPGRFAGYGYDMGPGIEKAKAETVVAIQIETLQALSQLDEILSVSGVDLAFIGPGDLGLDLQMRGGPDLEDAIAMIIAAGEKAGRTLGIFAPDRTSALSRQKAIPMVIQGSDAMYLGAAARQAFAKA